LGNRRRAIKRSCRRWRRRRSPTSIRQHGASAFPAGRSRSGSPSGWSPMPDQAGRICFHVPGVPAVVQFQTPPSGSLQISFRTCDPSWAGLT
jgi:hypothetical protein